MYFELMPDIFSEYVPEIKNDLPDGISFIKGAIIRESLPIPLIFETGHSEQEPPKGLHNRRIPVMSDLFISALQKAGVSNLQCFSAELRSNVDGSIWKNYQAVNIIGTLSCADLNASEFTYIIDRPGDAAMPLMVFDDLKIDPVRAREALLFRLAEDFGVIIIASNVVEYLRAQRSDDDWGITLRER